MREQLLQNAISQTQYYIPKTGTANSEKKESWELETTLSKVKTELVNSKKKLLIEGIKKAVIEHVYYSEKQMKINFSDYLSETLGYHYTYMANLFTKIYGKSVQSFIIETKIERVKELLVDEGMTLTEISFKLHYSSVAHLSNQFKKITGLSPSKYLASIAKTEGTKLNNLPEVFPSDTNQLSENISTSLKEIENEAKDVSFG